MRWEVEHHRGPASAFHARVLPEQPARQVWWHDVDRPALVLGSTQHDGVVDRAACAAAGVEVVRRRSGGGAVLLVPGEALWVDVLVPAGDPLWDDDVGRASWWVGEAWAEALTACGLGGLSVHRGRLVSAPWSRLVCFAGIGPGEVLLGDRKVVGVSQRRTRAVARFQCAAYLRWDPGALVDLLAPPRPSAADLAGAVAEVPASAAAVVDAFAVALRTR